MSSLLKEVQALKDKLNAAQKQLDSQAASSKTTVAGLEQKVAALTNQLKVSLISNIRTRSIDVNQSH